MKTRTRLDRRRGRVPAWTLLAGLLAAGAGCKSVPLRQERGQTEGEALGGQTDFRGVVDQDREVNVHLDLARAFEVQGKDEAAVGEYQRAVEVAESPASRRGGRAGKDQKVLAHRRMANALDRLGRFAQAEVHYGEALKLSPDDARVWNDSGYSLYLQRRWADAERTLRTASRIAPDDPKIQTNLGLCLAAADKTDEALAALSHAGGTAVAQANLGYILAAMGRPDEAREHYRAALVLEPDFGPARFALERLDAGPRARPGAGPAPETGLASALPEVPSTVIAPEPLILTGGAPPSPIGPPALAAPLPVVAPRPIEVLRPLPTSPATSPTPAPATPSKPGGPTKSPQGSSADRASIEAGIPLPTPKM